MTSEWSVRCRENLQCEHLSPKKTIRCKSLQMFQAGYSPSTSVSCAAQRVFTDKLLFCVNSTIFDGALQKRWPPQALQMEAADSTFHLSLPLCRLHSLSPSVFEAGLKVKVSPGRYRFKPARVDQQHQPSFSLLFFFFFLGVTLFKDWSFLWVLLPFNFFRYQRSQKWPFLVLLQRATCLMCDAS